MVQVRDKAWSQAGGRVQDERLLPRENVDVVLDAAVGVGQKGFAPFAGLKLVEFDRAQPVKERGAVVAANLDLRRRGRVEYSGRLGNARYSACQSPKSTATGPQGVWRSRGTFRTEGFNNRVGGIHSEAAVDKT